jgi:hypothetical protein
MPQKQSLRGYGIWSGGRGGDVEKVIAYQSVCIPLPLSSNLFDSMLLYEHDNATGETPFDESDPILSSRNLV